MMKIRTSFLVLGFGYSGPELEFSSDHLGCRSTYRLRALARSWPSDAERIEPGRTRVLDAAVEIEHEFAASEVLKRVVGELEQDVGSPFRPLVTFTPAEQSVVTDELRIVRDRLLAEAHDVFDGMLWHAHAYRAKLIYTTWSGVEFSHGAGRAFPPWFGRVVDAPREGAGFRDDPRVDDLRFRSPTYTDTEENFVYAVHRLCRARPEAYSAGMELAVSSFRPDLPARVRLLNVVTSVEQVVKARLRELGLSNRKMNDISLRDLLLQEAPRLSVLPPTDRWPAKLAESTIATISARNRVVHGKLIDEKSAREVVSQKLPIYLATMRLLLALLWEDADDVVMPAIKAFEGFVSRTEVAR